MVDGTELKFRMDKGLSAIEMFAADFLTHGAEVSCVENVLRYSKAPNEPG